MLANMNDAVKVRHTDSADVPGEWVRRHDRADLMRSYTNKDGFVYAEAKVVQAGVLLYVMPDGSTRKELITPEELKKQDSLGTLGNAPLTYEHPPVDVVPSNIQTYGVGNVGETVEFDEAGGFVKVRVVIRRADAIAAAASGRAVEVSPGYRCRIDSTPGIHPVYGAYDAIQRDREYNHLAMTEAARGGADIRLRMDGKDVLIPTGDSMNPKQLVLLAALVAMGVKRNDAEAAVVAEGDSKWDAFTKVCDTMQGKIDALQAQVDGFVAEKVAAKEEAAKTDKKTDSAAMLAFYNERAPLVATAERYKVDKIDTLDNAALKKAVVVAANPNVRKDGAEAYYDAAYDMLPAAENDAKTAVRKDAWSEEVAIETPAQRTDAKDAAKRDDAQESPESAYMTQINKQFKAAKR